MNWNQCRKNKVSDIESDLWCEVKIYFLLHSARESSCGPLSVTQRYALGLTTLRSRSRDPSLARAWRCVTERRQNWTS